ncbi:CDP-glycerol glycerophosphotransferase family protein [Rothia aerolata]|uniref:Uncharacterized protein n=1 Tax=Rothia aerolata TaxID=1812262 RepID=A0A917IVS4_9MICC|nr:CDP-glycerol glycerophosphotransferase family protein [Rothia aerolata]GGH65101.1 hypothetical protein GCM10007359_18010 [Rothia aerolata]
MPLSAPDLLTVVVESSSSLDRESELYRGLIAANLHWEDRYEIRPVSGPLTSETMRQICSSLDTKYVIFMRDTHSLSLNFMSGLLQRLSEDTQYLFEPKIYMGNIPADLSKTKLTDDYYYKRDTDIYGVAFNTRRLVEALETFSDLDRKSLYIAYRLYWSVDTAPIFEAGYSVNSVTKVAIGSILEESTNRLLPKIQSSVKEIRLYVLRLVVLYLRGLRETKKTQISVSHLREISKLFELNELKSKIELANTFEVGFISWIFDPNDYLFLFKQLTDEDSYLVFPSENEVTESYFPLYTIEFSDENVEIGKEYRPNKERPGYYRPATYDFYKRPITPNSKILFFDRPLQADDNAEHLYRYFMNNYPEYSNIYFALNRNSRDWSRLQTEGFNLVHFFSQEFYDLFLKSDLVVASQIYNLEYRGKSLINSRFVYLQHGIQLNDMTDWVLSKPFDIFVATGRNESDYLHKLVPRETLNSGIPRLEALSKNKSSDPEHLLFMPTWRFNLQTASTENFMESEYFKTINNLLTDPALLEYLEQKDKKLLVQLHPNLKKRTDCFQFSKRVVNSTYTYAEAIAKSEIVLTDYSSVVLDAAFIDIPIAYYPWDFEEFFKDQPYGSRLDYIEDGLGPVLTTHQEVIKYILNEEYKISDSTYLLRKERFFAGVDPDKINSTIAERMLAL